MVELARRRLPEASERLITARIEELPFPDASFDLVSATGVLEYAEVPRALAELARVLRPGGRAVVSYPNPDAVYGIWKSRVWYRAVRTAKRLLRRPFPDLPRGGPRIRPAAFDEHLRDAGLEPVSSNHTSVLVLPTPLDLVLPRAAARLGRRFEGRAEGSTSRLATQVVYLARKAST
jgi:SAM-dependent methyltransferase